MNRSLSLFIIIALSILTALSSAAQSSQRPDGWTDLSHGNRAPINYELILPDDRINDITITFSHESWQAEETDMIEIYGERGGARRPRPEAIRPDRMPDLAELADQLDRDLDAVRKAFMRFPDFEAIAEALDFETAELFDALGVPEGMRPSAGDGQRGISALAPGRDADLDRMQLSSRNPIWVPVTVAFNGETWWQVGFRYKGNSTLSVGWNEGTQALPFKLDFDEFEDDYPELDNQRFYGFKQLSFANNAFDPSWQRERVTADIFRDAGVPSAETAYYAVYVDKGDGAGAKYWGLYTAIELPDDTLIETQFADDDGNMYKPAGAGATFALGSFDEAHFDKETNRKSDFSDILAVFDALHADTRVSDPATWRAKLESVFDAYGFLRWLAANTLLQNFDTYGILAHNYYLYADEASGQLVWIPWDNNMALIDRLPTSATVRAMRRVIPNFGAALTFDFDIDGDSWSLISLLLNDPVYYEAFVDDVAEISADVFTPERMIPIYNANLDLLSAHLESVNRAAEISALRHAANHLVAHVRSRAKAAEAFLARQSSSQ